MWQRLIRCEIRVVWTYRQGQTRDDTTTIIMWIIIVGTETASCLELLLSDDNNYSRLIQNQICRIQWQLLESLIKLNFAVITEERLISKRHFAGDPFKKCITV